MSRDESFSKPKSSSTVRVYDAPQLDEVVVKDEVWNDSDVSNDSFVTTDAIAIEPSSSEVKAKILSKEYSISSRGGKSKIWKIFGRIINKTGQEISNMVVCKVCNSAFKFHEKSTSNLLKHKCYIIAKSHSQTGCKVDIDAETKKMVTQLCSQWAVENYRALDIVEDSGLRKLAACLISIGGKFGVNVDVTKVFPHPTTLAGNINHLYATCKKELKGELLAAKDNGFGLTSDVWTDDYSNRSYMPLTVHYVKDGKLFNHLLGLTSMPSKTCTSDNIRQVAQQLLSEFDCSLKDKIAFVTHTGVDMVAAFGNYNNISCINHLLHNILEMSLDNVNEIIKLCDASTKLLTFLKSSGKNNILKTTYAPTRWNTIYHLLDTIDTNWEEIKSLKEKKRLDVSNDIDLNCLKAVLQVLKPFNETLCELESENIPTIHLTLVHINNLKKVCHPYVADIGIIKDLKKKLLTLLDTHVLHNLSIFHKVALFLFPPANKLIYFNEHQKQLIKNQCKTLMNLYIADVDEEEFPNVPVTLPATKKAKLFTDFIQQAESSNTENRIMTEINIYENTTVSYHDDFNVLQWWQMRQIELPLLYKVSCRVLAIPASSAASVRCLSRARPLIFEKHSPLESKSQSKSVSQIMFLNFNSKTEDEITDTT